MAAIRKAYVHRLPAGSPDDASEITAAIKRGAIHAQNVIAVLGKTEGNGCVNDFTRGFATFAIRRALAQATGRSEMEIERDVAFVMSGGTEGGLSPHWLVFEVRVESTPTHGHAALALGVSMTPEFKPEELGRSAQIHATADAVQAAMKSAGITQASDVHYVQVKCPLLSKQRMADAAARGATVVTEDTYLSMGYSRGASALGVALALGEVSAAAINDRIVCNDASLYSGCASTSAGIELMHNQIMVLGNSTQWSSDWVVGHGVMQDALDVDAVGDAVAPAKLTLGAQLRDRARIAAVLAKCEPSRSGLIRGRRHVMLDDSDIHASRHARALVGGVLGGLFGDTQLFISGGAEHQGPDGGGPVAVIARRPGA
jgi:cyanuric acid amidohydrolase